MYLLSRRAVSQIVRLLPVLLGTGATVLAHAAPGENELVSVPYSPGVYSGPSNLGLDEAVSGDGRYVVFHSRATNLVPSIAGASARIYLRDRLTGSTEQVDIDPGGAQPNGDSADAAVSADGRYVAFYSVASNLVVGDTNGWGDIFVRDRWLHVTKRVSVASDGTQSNALNIRTSVGARISLSDDGRFVAFFSQASNLVPGDTNGLDDIFVHDRQLGTTERVNLDAMGNQLGGPSWGDFSLSGDGRFVAFSSSANDIIPGESTYASNVFVRDRLTGQVQRVSVNAAGIPANDYAGGPSISADGRFVAFWSNATNLVPGDMNNQPDIFVHDRVSGSTELVTVSSSGVQANNWPSDDVSISADGRFVAFGSVADNLVSSDLGNRRHDIFVRDRQKKETQMVSVPLTGAHANGSSWNASVSADGRFVAFGSAASNLVADGQAGQNVFIRELPSFAFTLKPSALAFGDQVVLTSRTRSFWLHNTGSTSLPITSITVRGMDRAMFTRTHSCGAAVAIGSTCRISVTFRPTSLGPKSAQLRIVAEGDTVRNRALTGTGVNFTP